jgi:hypothetical protein
MKKIIPVVLIFTILFTGCIEIVEEITLHKNQSGNIRYRIKTNQLISFIDNFTNWIDLSFENQLKSEADKFASKIKKQEGIDSVKINLSGKFSDYNMGFSFSSADNLNNAFYEVFGYKPSIFSPKYLKVTEHHLSRKNFSPWVKKYFEQEGIELPTGELLNNVYFKTVIYFPKEIKKHRGDNISLSGDRKVLTQKNKLMNVIENKSNVSIKSKY